MFGDDDIKSLDEKEISNLSSFMKPIMKKNMDRKSSEGTYFLYINSINSYDNFQSTKINELIMEGLRKDIFTYKHKSDSEKSKTYRFKIDDFYKILDLMFADNGEVDVYLNSKNDIEIWWDHDSYFFNPRKTMRRNRKKKNLMSIK